MPQHPALGKQDSIYTLVTPDGSGFLIGHCDGEPMAFLFTQRTQAFAYLEAIGKKDHLAVNETVGALANELIGSGVEMAFLNPSDPSRLLEPIPLRAYLTDQRADDVRSAVHSGVPADDQQSDNWDRICRLMEYSDGPLAELLRRNGEIARREQPGNAVVISLPGDFRARVANDKKNSTLLADAIAATFGSDAHAVFEYKGETTGLPSSSHKGNSSAEPLKKELWALLGHCVYSFHYQFGKVARIEHGSVYIEFDKFGRLKFAWDDFFTDLQESNPESKLKLMYSPQRKGEIVLFLNTIRCATASAPSISTSAPAPPVRAEAHQASSPKPLNQDNGQRTESGDSTAVARCGFCHETISKIASSCTSCGQALEQHSTEGGAASVTQPQQQEALPPPESVSLDASQEPERPGSILGALGAGAVAWIAGSVAAVSVMFLALTFAGTTPEENTFTLHVGNTAYALGRTFGHPMSGRAPFAGIILLSLPYCGVSFAFGLTLGILSKAFNARMTLIVTIAVIWAISFLYDVTMANISFLSQLDRETFGLSLAWSVKQTVNSLYLITAGSMIAAWISTPYVLAQAMALGRTGRFIPTDDIRQRQRR